MVNEFIEIDGGLFQSLLTVAQDAVRRRLSAKDQWRIREITAFYINRLVASSLNRDVLADVVATKLRRQCFEPRKEVRSSLDISSNVSHQVNRTLSVGKVSALRINLDEETVLDIWAKHEESIASEICDRMKALDALRQKANNETDPLEKQKLLVLCRREFQALKQAAQNTQDVCKKLDVVLELLGDINEQLTSMDGKLNDIQDTVSSIHQLMLQNLSRPVLEVIEEWSEDFLQKHNSQWQKDVYIENEVCRGGDKGDFTVHEKLNPSRLMSEAVKDFFTNEIELEPLAAGKSKKNLLLMTGAAGSGKSTAIVKAKLYVLGEYKKKKAEKGINVVLLPGN